VSLNATRRDSYRALPRSPRKLREIIGDKGKEFTFAAFVRYISG